jgi:hypothetical protein
MRCKEEKIVLDYFCKYEGALKIIGMPGENAYSLWIANESDDIIEKMIICYQVPCIGVSMLRWVNIICLVTYILVII